MEQRIEPPVSPVHVATTDPAAVPGITPPVQAAAADPKAGPEAEPDVEPATGPVEEEAEAVDEPAAEKSGDARPTEGPSFEASDRRSVITADASGVVLKLDDQIAEFEWDEISAVEYDTDRKGRRLTVTVHMPNQRWFPAEVESKDKDLVEEWTKQLDSVLDTFFEE